jgi:hypothetical protein
MERNENEWISGVDGGSWFDNCNLAMSWFIFLSSESSLKKNGIKNNKKTKKQN